MFDRKFMPWMESLNKIGRVVEESDDKLVAEIYPDAPRDSTCLLRYVPTKKTADRIAELQAENERLRGYLELIAECGAGMEARKLAKEALESGEAS